MQNISILRLGNTPLHYASKKRNYDICKLLIESGANINAVNKYNFVLLKGINILHYIMLRIMVLSTLTSYRLMKEQESIQ